MGIVSIICMIVVPLIWNYFLFKHIAIIYQSTNIVSLENIWFVFDGVFLILCYCFTQRAISKGDGPLLSYIPKKIRANICGIHKRSTLVALLISAFYWGNNMYIRIILGLLIFSLSRKIYGMIKYSLLMAPCDDVIPNEGLVTELGRVIEYVNCINVNTLDPQNFEISSGFIRSEPPYVTLLKKKAEVIHYIHIINKTSPYIFLFAHGNADSISHFFKASTNMHLMLKHGSIFMFDYYGFGKSSGFQSEHALYECTHRSWEFLISQKYAPSNIILYGESMGCSSVLYEANVLANLGTPLTAVILVSPFYNLKTIVFKVVSHGFPLLAPLARSLISESEMCNNEILKSLCGKYPNLPIIIFHSLEDNLTPYEHSVKLQAQNKNVILRSIDGYHAIPQFSANDDIFIGELLDNKKN